MLNRKPAYYKKLINRSLLILMRKRKIASRKRQIRKVKVVRKKYKKIERIPAKALPARSPRFAGVYSK